MHLATTQNVVKTSTQ